MPLPISYAKANVNDVGNRFKFSAIEFNERPVFVLDVDIRYPSNKECVVEPGTEKVVHLCIWDITRHKNPKTAKWVDIRHPELSIRSLGNRLGFFNLTDTLAVYMSRYPIRSRLQGLNWNNTIQACMTPGESIRVLGNPPSNLGMASTNLIPLLGDIDITDHRYMCDKYGFNYAFMYSMLHANFIKMYNRQYPNAKELLDKHTTPTVQAISPKYVLERDGFGDFYILCKGVRVGKMSSYKARYLDNKEYLAGDVERTTGIQPI